jgi:DNA-binding MarR family transcriptional regulator
MPSTGPSTQSVTLADYRALAEVRYCIRCFLDFSETAARAAGIEPRQHQLLLVLKGLGPDGKPTIAAVAERLRIAHNSAVELTKRSARSGLIVRRTSRTDRREASLVITARGERLLRSLSLAHRDELRLASPTLVRALRALVPLRRRPAGKRAGAKS